MANISVIVPNFNHASYLEKRIYSILNQTYQDFELIILDDKSSDNSKEAIEQYRNHPKVSQIIYNKINSGSPFKQWQKGINLAIGKYIWIAESDDFADSSFLEKTVHVLDSQEDVSLVYTQSFVVDENSEIIRANYSWTSDLDERRWNKNYVNDGKDEAVRYFLRKNIIPNASAALFRKSALKNITIWPVNMKMLGDWFFWIQLISSNKVAYLSECLNYFRATSQSTRIHDSFEKKKNRLEEQLIVLYKNAELNSIPIATVRDEYIRLLRSFYHMFSYYNKKHAFPLFLLSPSNLKLVFKII